MAKPVTAMPSRQITPDFAAHNPGYMLSPINRSGHMRAKPGLAATGPGLLASPDAGPAGPPDDANQAWRKRKAKKCKSRDDFAKTISAAIVASPRMMEL